MAEERPIRSLTEPLRCRDAVEALIEDWHATGEILRAPAAGPGRDLFRLATGARGVWILLQLEPDPAEATLGRASSAGVTWALFDSECRVTRRETAPSAPALPRDGYTDTDLVADLASHERLVVFLWSPHMPISVDAYAEIAEACRSLSLPLRALTDPSSDPGYVKRVVEERSIPPEAGLALASAELLFRDLAVHAPSVLVLTRTDASALLPGYRNRKAYEAFLRDAAAVP